MGLNKSIDTPYGVAAIYWRLVHFAMDFNAQKATCVMIGYKDKAARDEGKTPLANRQVEVSGVDFTGINENTSQRTQLYNLIKVLPEFEGATDAIEE